MHIIILKDIAYIHLNFPMCITDSIINLNPLKCDKTSYVPVNQHMTTNMQRTKFYILCYFLSIFLDLHM